MSSVGEEKSPTFRRDKIPAESLSKTRAVYTHVYLCNRRIGRSGAAGVNRIFTFRYFVGINQSRFISVLHRVVVVGLCNEVFIMM